MGIPIGIPIVHYHRISMRIPVGIPIGIPIGITIGWGFPQDSMRIPMEIAMGIPTGFLWEWELKFYSHGNPGRFPSLAQSLGYDNFGNARKDFWASAPG